MASRKRKPNRFGCLLVLGLLFLAGLITALLLISNPYQAIIKSTLRPIFQQIHLIAPNLPLANQPTTPTKKVRYSFAILSDTHEDTTYFPKIVDQIKTQDFVFVAHLGDLSNAGDKAKLQQAKNILDQISEPVYVLPGDHDLNWLPHHDLTNFKQVFHENQTYFSFSRAHEHFIFIDNSNLNTGLDPDQWQWLQNDLARTQLPHIYVFMSTPLSNPYLSFKTMGSQNDQVAAQARDLAGLLKKYHVTAIFAGDTHTYSQYPDKYSQIPTITVGSAGSTKNPLPLYIIVEIFEDGSYNATSVPLGHAIPIKGTD